MYKVTIFTPTYNRAYTIENLYKSLKEQVFTEFEWIVIDDGSTDNTEDMFKIWKKEANKFPITYLKQENGGKHRAINKALDIAKGELFFIVDSDDIITNDALLKIVEWDNSIKDIKHKFAGIAGNKGYSKNQIVGKTFKGNFVDATSLEREKYNIYGDKAEVFYTDILRKFKFPEIEGENFITETVVWYKIANEGYKIRWFNEVIYICDYLDDGLTKNRLEILERNPKGYALSIKQDIKYKKYRLKEKVHIYNLYYEILKSKFSIKEISYNLEINQVILILMISLKNIKNKLREI